MESACPGTKLRNSILIQGNAYANRQTRTKKQKDRIRYLQKQRQAVD
jgi:hypothetical protein